MCKVLSAYIRKCGEKDIKSYIYLLQTKHFTRRFTERLSQFPSASVIVLKGLSDNKQLFLTQWCMFNYFQLLAFNSLPGNLVFSHFYTSQ